MLQSVKSTAVVYYSRSGHTHTAAVQIARTLGAERYRLTVDRYGGRLGYLVAAYDSLRQSMPEITSTPPALRGFRAVVFCAPIWTSYPATPLRSFLRGHPPLPGTLGLFLTCGQDAPQDKAVAMAESDLGRSFAVHGHLGNGVARKDVMEKRIEEFCAQLQAQIKVPA